MSRGTLSLIGLAVAGSVTVLFAIATFDWMAWTCRLPNPTTETSRPFALGPGGCFEFWLYRYQTMITGLAAVLAAGVTVAATRSQVRLANKAIIQNQLITMRSAYKQAVEAQTKATEADVWIRDFLAAFADVGDNYFDATHKHTADAIQKGSRDLVRFARDVLAMVRSSGAGQEAELAASEFVRLCQATAEFEEVFEDFLPHFFFMRDIVKKNYAPHDYERKILGSDELARLRALLEKVRTEGNALRQQAKSLRSNLETSLSEQASMINKSEVSLRAW